MSKVKEIINEYAPLQHLTDDELLNMATNLDANEKATIRRLWDHSEFTAKDLARMFQVSVSDIKDLVANLHSNGRGHHISKAKGAETAPKSPSFTREIKQEGS